MAISDLIGASLEAPVAAIRRYVLFYSIAAAAAIGSLIYGAAAVTGALELAVGPVAARGIMAGILATIAAASAFAPRLFRSKSPAQSAEAKMQGMSSEEKVATVLEALQFGYSLGARKPSAQSSDGRK